MYTTAFVKTINDDGTVLVGCSTDACNGCKAEAFCNNKNDNTFLARNDNNIKLTEGQLVTLFLPPGKTIFSTVMVFGFPLVLFPIGYVLMKHFTSCNEIICALGGFAAMALAFATAGIINVKNKRDLMPVIQE